MRIHTLHRRVIRDMEMMIDDVNTILPVRMPNRWETRSLNLGAFVKRLNTVTEPFNVINEILPDPSTPAGASVVSGVWYPADLLPANDSDADVRVIWHPHPGSYRIKMTPTTWARRRYYFWERLAHEFVHRYQDLERPDDTEARTFRVRTDDEKAANEQQTYYSDYDELEAYAHDAALEMLTWWPDLTFKQAIGKANKLDVDARVWSSYHNYLSSFEVGHPARPHFRRKAKQWYHAMQQTPDFYAKLELPKLV